MAAAKLSPAQERNKAYKDRVNKAKKDRDLRAPHINEFYRLAAPHRGRIGSEKTSPLSADEVMDELDTTLTETVDDFASDMIAQFTPPYEPWVTHEPTRVLKEEQRKAVESQLASAVSWFWDDIGESSYYDAADECFHELANGTMGMRRLDYGAAQPIIYEPVPIKGLLIDRGPDGSADFRGTDGKISKKHFLINYGRWAVLPRELKVRFDAMKEDAMVYVIDGVHRVWDIPGKTQWRRIVMLENELVYEKLFDEDGAESMYVARWRTEELSAYGIGAGWRACAPARVLRELHALVLAQMHNVVDKPHAYSDPDGSANLEQGITAGDWLLLGEGFDVKALGGDGEFQAAFYKTEDLRMLIKRALYQDKPEQRGDTPPSATQWADESARSQQRFEIPRGKIIREWVVPVVRGHQWIRTKHGRFPEVRIGSDAIMLKPQTPQVKARSFEKLSKAERLLASASGTVLQEAAKIAIEPVETMANMKRAIGDELVKLRTPEEVKELLEKAAQQMQQMQDAGVQ